MQLRQQELPLTSPSALKRLTRDWKEFESASPVTNITASPEHGNLFKWHARLVGPPDTHFRDTSYHLILHFPYNYPIKPPTVELSTRIPRSHVFSSWICLDMLETHSSGPYSGWSTSYTALTILIQLQSWLFYDDEQVWSKVSCESANQRAREFKCSRCPVEFEKLQDKDLPPIPKVCKRVEWEESRCEKVETSGDFGILPDDVISEIFSFLEPVDLLKSVGSKMPRLSLLIVGRSLLEKDETICFHSKVSFQEEILGYGISTECNRLGKIVKITSPLELIGEESYFKQKIRTSVWREHFDYFLPLWINRDHGKGSLPLAEREIPRILGETTFHPEQALTLLSKLMTTQVVEVMGGKVHASIKALDGYFHFHRLLIAFIQKYPKLQNLIDSKVAAFLKDEKNRHKDVTPNMGEFLCLLSVSNYTWKEVAPLVLTESICRNVFWVIKDGIDVERCSDVDLVKVFFDHAQVSRNLILFNYFFLVTYARPNGMSLDNVAEIYDTRFGQSTHQQKELLQKGIFHIFKVNSWDSYLKKIGVSPKEGSLVKIIRESIVLSEKRGYHTKPKFRQPVIVNTSRGIMDGSTPSNEQDWRQKRKEFQNSLKKK